MLRIIILNLKLCHQKTGFSTELHDFSQKIQLANFTSEMCNRHDYVID